MSYWAKVAGNYFANRKVRKAGADGAFVFLFVLTQNATRGARGFIPAGDLDPWYVADQLMISEERARAGIERALAAGLIAVRGDATFEIVGWDDDWARMPLTNAERQQRFRMRNGRNGDGNDFVTAITASNDNVTTDNAAVTRNVEEKRREEENKKREESADKSASPAFDLKLTEPKPKRGRPRKPRLDEPTEAEAASVRVILDKLSTHNGVSYRASSKHTALIVGRLREGHTEHELRVVTYWCAVGRNWKNDPKMQEYLRPETLFGPDKFAGYVEPALAWYATLPSDEPVGNLPHEYRDDPAFAEPDWMGQ